MPQGRKPAPPPQPVADTLDRQQLAAANAASQADSARSMEIAERFGDGTPYEQRRIVSEARFYLGQSAEAMLEAGKRLVQIKENEPHGVFLEIVEGRLGLHERAAQRLMAAAVKYLSPRLQSNATTLSGLGRSKLLELVTVDDDDLEDLAEGGTLAGHTLDEIEAMSVRELKAALREERERLAAKDKLIAKKDEKLNALAEAEERRRSGTPNEQEVTQLEELRDAALGAQVALQRLVKVVGDTMDTPATESAELAARQTIDWVCQRLVENATSIGITLDFGTEVDPVYVQQLREQIEAAHAAAEAKRAARKGGKGRRG